LAKVEAVDRHDYEPTLDAWQETRLARRLTPRCCATRSSARG
jgi:hypothetical protein